MNPRHGRRRRKPVSEFLAPRSKRSFEDACALAGLPEVGSAAQLSETYLRLLVEGIDHERVGHEWWVDAILSGAPDSLLSAFLSRAESEPRVIGDLPDGEPDAQD